jgi:hypothetical protein
MKILVLHSEDRLTSAACNRGYDLVVDLGRAPAAFYEDWSRKAGCPVIGLSEFADAEGDLYRTKSHMQAGANHLIDRMGIDWWSVLSPEIIPSLTQLILIHRLARYTNKECDIYSSRSDYRAAALHALLGGRLINLETSFQSAVRRLRHYSEVVSKFDSTQLFQIAQDKFDGEHNIRRRFVRRGSSSRQPLILLPSAYINVSHTAISYASLLPEEQFLMVCARDSAKVHNLPANVRMISLDPFFSSPNSGEVSSLVEAWTSLKMRLISSAPEFQSGVAVGTFDPMPKWIRWGITIRDAWNRLFESENIRSCFCADHNNPYTRIPLLLAKHWGIPALACHHGALDATMAIFPHAADFYVAKSEMERDYMTRVCGISPEKVLAVPPPHQPGVTLRLLGSQDSPWLVFFSEPYDASSWRTDEVYRELLPQLCSLAAGCGLKLVFKLHPFETAKNHRRMLLRHLAAEKVQQIKILTGPISEQLWQNTRFAITAESSVALECAARSIPIFLCGWLRDSFSGYVDQYQRFGVGHVLEAASHITDIPRLLELEPAKPGARQNQPDRIGAEILRELLGNSHPLPIASNS